MTKPLRIEVYQTSLVDENELLFESDIQLPLRIGRQEKGRFPGVWLDEPKDDFATIAPNQESSKQVHKLSLIHI